MSSQWSDRQEGLIFKAGELFERGKVSYINDKIEDSLAAYSEGVELLKRALEGGRSE